MTTAKNAHVLPPRTPAYVSAEVGAAELCISVATWHAWVKSRVLPQPVRLGAAGASPRWRWQDVDEYLAGKRQDEQEKPFFDMAVINGTSQNKRRASAAGRADRPEGR